MSDTAYNTEEFKIEGFTFKASFFYDPCRGAPWEENDGHGPVREVSSRDCKTPGEIVLHSSRGAVWLYDLQTATDTARKEWGIDDGARAKLAAQLGREPTRGEIAARSVQSDIAYLRGWLNDTWHWVIVSVALVDDDGEESSKHSDSCSGFESSDTYPLEWAKGEAASMAETIKAEAAEVQYWAERDVVTA